MAAIILNSPRTVEMSVYVVRAFVRLRELMNPNLEPAFETRCNIIRMEFAAQ
jgi:hypothetical protein